MRRAVVLAHRWLGLAASLWLALIALSGIGMVFSTAFWAWEYGTAQTHVEPRDQPFAAPETWLAKAEAKYGKLPAIEGYFGPRATPMRISAPTIVYEPQGRHAHGIVTVDPYTGEPLAHLVAEDSWAFIPLWLHLSLFLPETISSWVLALLAVLLSGFGLSGLWLWWPGRGRIAAAAAIPRPRSPVSLRRFHSAIGLWISPLLALAAITGLMLARFDVAEVLTAPLGASAEFDPKDREPAVCAAPAAPGAVLSAARAAFPGTEMAQLHVPSADYPYFTAWLRPADTTVPARGDRELVFDRCGAKIFERGPEAMRAGDTVLIYMVELHNGRLAGLFGEGLILLQGIALTVLPLAGMTLWWWRRRRTRRMPIALQPAE